jgi:hypothetical protein
MVLGLTLQTFTFLHVTISLIAIAAGLIALIAMIGGGEFKAITALFLICTALTSLTGFLFPFEGITPGVVIGILSLIVLAVALVARRRGWRGTYVITAILALYLNVFVLIVQSFEKVRSLHALAPTQTETPFKVAQLLTLVLFVALTTLAFKRYRTAI